MSIKLLFRVAFCVFSLAPFCARSQKNIDKELASSLKKAYKDDKLAAYAYQTSYEFKVGDNVEVVAEDNINMISLEGAVRYSREIYYNSHIAVQSANVEYASGKSLDFGKTCGSYEVDDIFYSDAQVCSYTFGFLNEGLLLDFKSREKYDDAKYLTRVFFHDELAVAARTIRFAVPATINIELVEKNFDGWNITKTITQEGKQKIYTYTVKNLQAMKSESNSLGVLYYYPHLVVITKDYTNSSGKTTVIASTSDLYKWYSTIVKDVKNDPTAFQKEVARLTATAKTPEDKIKAIYYWVQDNIKYIAFEDGIAGFRPDAAQNVYNNRFGDCKGMANLTKEMLKAAGFDARLTWIGTNRIPYTYDLPSLAVDNHMICTVNVGDKQYILDSTEKFIGLGKYAERIQGKEIMIENGNQYQIKKVPTGEADQNMIARTEEIEVDGEVLKGKGQIVIEGESLKNILYVSTNVKQENQKKLFDNMAVSDFTNTDKVTVTNQPPIDRDKAMEVGYTYELRNKVTSFGDDVYLDIDWNKGFHNLKMENDRMSDYYFHRKIKNKIVKKVKVPAGYKVSHVPANVMKKHPDFSMSVSFEQAGNQLIYTNEITITHGLIKKADFATWNTFVKELSDMYDDQVILTKAK